MEILCFYGGNLLSFFVSSHLVLLVYNSAIDFGIFITYLAISLNSHYFLIAFQMILLGFLDISILSKNNLISSFRQRSYLLYLLYTDLYWMGTQEQCELIKKKSLASFSCPSLITMSVILHHQM